MIDAYTNQTVTLLTPQDPDDWSEKRDPVERKIQARVDWINKLVRNIEGEEVTSAVQVIIAYDSTIYYDHKIRIDNVEHSIIKIDRIQDFSSQYLRVFLS